MPVVDVKAKYKQQSHFNVLTQAVIVSPPKARYLLNNEEAPYSI